MLSFRFELGPKEGLLGPAHGLWARARLWRPLLEVFVELIVFEQSQRALTEYLVVQVVDNVTWTTSGRPRRHVECI